MIRPCKITRVKDVKTLVVTTLAAYVTALQFHKLVKIMRNFKNRLRLTEGYRRSSIRRTRKSRSLVSKSSTSK